MTQDLDILFPAPTLSHLAPAPPPGVGVNGESTKELVRLLKENHVQFHCFFNEKGFHNHLSHHLLAAYFLGATPKVLRDAYDMHAKFQRKRFKSPCTIDKSNWKDHLGDEEYYDAYFNFFSAELLKHGHEITLQRYVFSQDANWGAKEGDKHPEMISRLLGGLVHPIIFAGYGLEFGLPGMIVEGIAQAAVHKSDTSDLLTREFLQESTNSESLVNGLGKLSLKPTAASATPFAIIQNMLNDRRLTMKRPKMDLTLVFPTTIKDHGSIIEEYANMWEADTSTPEAVARSLEEIAWVVTLLYGVGGYKQGRHFAADFFGMHLVNSSLFLPSYVACLTSKSLRLLLRSFFAVVLGYWVSQGKVSLDIAAFYEGTSASPTAKPHEKSLAKEHSLSNAWDPLLQKIVAHPNEHLLKLIRALAHYSTLYGTTPKGKFSGKELKGAELLDGTLFIRTAWLSFERAGQLREVEGLPGGTYWDFEGFYEG